MRTLLRIWCVQMSSGESESAAMAAVKAGAPWVSSTKRRLSGSRAPKTLRLLMGRDAGSVASGPTKKDCLRRNRRGKKGAGASQGVQ